MDERGDAAFRLLARVVFATGQVRVSSGLTDGALRDLLEDERQRYGRLQHPELASFPLRADPDERVDVDADPVDTYLTVGSTRVDVHDDPTEDPGTRDSRDRATPAGGGGRAGGGLRGSLLPRVPAQVLAGSADAEQRPGQGRRPARRRAPRRVRRPRPDLRRFRPPVTPRGRSAAGWTRPVLRPPVRRPRTGHPRPRDRSSAALRAVPADDARSPGDVLGRRSARTAGRLSEYAATEPVEYVAEIFTALVFGRRLHADQLELYRRWAGHGPVSAGTRPSPHRPATFGHWPTW
ncbi:hypothetical protein SFUMM280S_01065 [Streptomyces fumanus]